MNRQSIRNTTQKVLIWDNEKSKRQQDAVVNDIPNCKVSRTQATQAQSVNFTFDSNRYCELRVWFTVKDSKKTFNNCSRTQFHLTVKCLNKRKVTCIPSDVWETERQREKEKERHVSICIDTTNDKCIKQMLGLVLSRLSVGVCECLYECDCICE